LILLDTNVLLEVVFGRSRAKECRVLLDRMSEGEVSGVVTRFSVHAMEAILGGKAKDKLNPFLRGLEQTQGLSIYDTSTTDEIAASMVMERIERDFDDSLQYYVAKKLGVQSIVSFDKDFDGLDIPRREPKDFAGP
jgi:predicted nucleic acid-binding protein